MSEYVHIVSLIAPSPPDFGGAFDLYYKIPELAKLGKKVILHYFDYKQDRGHLGLETYCIEINRYQRTGLWRSLVTLQPYIVSSRLQNKLIDRLNLDEYPVLLEGIHCTGVIPYVHDRKILVRVHNDEAAYYNQLKRNESNILKSVYYLYESALLSSYQKKLSTEPVFLFVSESDRETFRAKYHQQKQFFLPCFVPWQKLNCLEGKGNYCLYHGNLSISENINAAIWLAQSIFSELDFKLVIAGKSAECIKGKLPFRPNISFVNNPTNEELFALIQNAHINLLPSLNSTGVKLKLIHALFDGRFCFTNHEGVAGSGLEGRVKILKTTAEWMKAIREIMNADFTKSMIDERKASLDTYNNETNGRQLNVLL